MDKPKDFLSSLGVDVQMESKGMQPDNEARERLRMIGKTLGAGEIAKGLEYKGSFAFHIFVDKNSLMKDRYEISSITQIAIDDISEAAASLAFNNGVVALRKYFNPNFKPGRRGDKR